MSKRQRKIKQANRFIFGVAILIIATIISWQFTLLVIVSGLSSLCIIKIPSWADYLYDEEGADELGGFFLSIIAIFFTIFLNFLLIMAASAEQGLLSIVLWLIVAINSAIFLSHAYKLFIKFYNSYINS